MKMSFMNKYTDEIYSSDGMKQGDNVFAVMQAQKLVAFHRAFTSANLCEYYVNLEKNTFDTFKVESSLMTAFEQSHTWDELVTFFVDNYVIEEDKKTVTDFYNRSYITGKIKGLETELCQECRIILKGKNDGSATSSCVARLKILNTQ